MGFGLMFIGACFMLLGGFSPLAPFTYVLGSAIILYSLKELIRQNKAFLMAMILTGVEFILSMVNMFIAVFSSNQKAIDALSLTISIFSVVLCATIATAIYIISRDVDLPAIQTKVIVTYIFMGIYLVFLVLANSVFRNNEKAIGPVSIVVLLSQILYVIMLLVTIANSYIRICYEDDKDMESKTGNAPLDFLNEKLNTAMTPKEKRNLDKKDKGDKSK